MSVVYFLSTSNTNDIKILVHISIAVVEKNAINILES